MISFLAALSMRTKLIAIAVVLVGVGFGYRWHTNSIYEEGFQKGRIRGLEELEEEQQKQWQEAFEGIQSEWDTLEEEEKALAAQREELQRIRARLSQEYANAIEESRRSSRDEIRDLAGADRSALVGHIRRLLAELDQLAD